LCWPAARDADQPLSMQGPWSRPHTTLLCLPQGAQTYSEKPGHRFALNQSWDAVKAEAYDALVIPGCPPRCGACSLTVVRLMQRRTQVPSAAPHPQHCSLCMQSRSCQLHVHSWRPELAPSDSGRVIAGVVHPSTWQLAAGHIQHRALCAERRRAARPCTCAWMPRCWTWSRTSSAPEAQGVFDAGAARPSTCAWTPRCWTWSRILSTASRPRSSATARSCLPQSRARSRGARGPCPCALLALLACASIRDKAPTV